MVIPRSAQFEPAAVLATGDTGGFSLLAFLIALMFVIVPIFLAARKKRSEQKRLLEIPLHYENWTKVHVDSNHAVLFNLLGPRFCRVEDRLWLAQYNPTVSAFEFRQVLEEGKLGGQAIICDKSVGLGGPKQESGAEITRIGASNFQGSPEQVAEGVAERIGTVFSAAHFTKLFGEYALPEGWSL